MANLTKRVQVLVSDEDWSALARLAQAKGASIGQLIRDALAQVYFTPEGKQDLASRRQRVDQLVALNLPLTDDWSALEDEIEARAYEDEYAHGR